MMKLLEGFFARNAKWMEAGNIAGALKGLEYLECTQGQALEVECRKIHHEIGFWRNKDGRKKLCF
ncbi:hypothetical protein [Polaromonas sp. P5_D5]